MQCQPGCFNVKIFWLTFVEEDIAQNYSKENRNAKLLENIKGKTVSQFIKHFFLFSLLIYFRFSFFAFRFSSVSRGLQLKQSRISAAFGQ